MARRPKLKPVHLASRKAWCVNVPVSLSDTGRRRQLFYINKVEANTACEQLRARQDNFGRSLTALSPARIAEAAECFKLVDAVGVRLSAVVREWLDQHRARTKSVTFRTLFDEYLEAKKGKHPGYLRDLRIQRDRKEVIPLHIMIVSDIGSRDLAPILDRMTNGARNAVMRYLRAIFNFGIRRGYLQDNPISKLDFADRVPGEVPILEVDQAHRMLVHALEHDLELLPFLVVCLFCGIRPHDEASELLWSDIKDDVIVIRPEVSKTHRRRFPKLPDNAKAWLRAYADRGGKMGGPIMPLAPRSLLYRRKLNWEAAGFTRWEKQSMRHSYCSYFLNARQGTADELCLQSGHDDPGTMWERYFAGIPEPEAKRYWELYPPAPEMNIVPIFKSA